MQESLLSSANASQRSWKQGAFSRRICLLLGLVGLFGFATLFVSQQQQQPTPLQQTPRVEHAPSMLGLWARSHRAPGDIAHEITFVVRPKNEDKLEKLILEELTNPKSAKFREWLSTEEVEEMTRNEEGMQALQKSLEQLEEVSESEQIGSHLVRAWAPLAAWERYLGTEFHMFRHPDVDVLQPRADKFTFPQHLEEHLAGILNVLDLEHILPVKKNDHVALNETDGLKMAAMPNLEKYQIVTPHKLKTAYNVPDFRNAKVKEASTTQAVFASLRQSWSPTDLSIFQKLFELEQAPVEQLDNRGGPEASIASNDAKCKAAPGDCAEANLDVQYMTAMSPMSPTGLYYVQSVRSVNGQMNLFLQLVQALGALRDPPRVISISYGGPDVARPDSTISAFNLVAKTLAAQGVTIVASSGDDGANGVQSFARGWSCQAVLNMFGLVTSWPASSPWVTSVGALMGLESGKPEIACSAGETDGMKAMITSGGGFSKKVAKPQWQPPWGQYAGRGVPDVSLAGHSYLVIDGGKVMLLDGTSASAPVFAGMVTLINAYMNMQQSNEDEVKRELAAATELASTTCDVETGGTCNLIPCDSSRGPTQCVNWGHFKNRCMCQPGYCAQNGACFPNANVCAAETGVTCRLLPCEAWRGATCKNVFFDSASSGFWKWAFTRKCVCPVGTCSVNGKCTPTSRKNSRKSVGFINAIMYQHPEAFTDITVGNNECGRAANTCCGGYNATTGWDPVTGLGAPDFRKLAAVLGVTVS